MHPYTIPSSTSGTSKSSTPPAVWSDQETMSTAGFVLSLAALAFALAAAASSAA